MGYFHELLSQNNPLGDGFTFEDGSGKPPSRDYFHTEVNKKHLYTCTVIYKRMSHSREHKHTYMQLYMHATHEHRDLGTSDLQTR